MYYIWISLASVNGFQTTRLPDLRSLSVFFPTILFLGWNNFFCRNELVSFYVKEECNNIRMYVIAVCNSLLYELYSIIYFCMCVIRRNGHPNQWEKKGLLFYHVGHWWQHTYPAGWCCICTHEQGNFVYCWWWAASRTWPWSLLFFLLPQFIPPQNARMREKLICGGVMRVSRDDDGRQKNNKKKPPEKSDNFSGFFSICFRFPSKMHIRLSCVIFSKFRFDITLYFLFSCLYSCSLVLEEKEIRVNKKKPYGKI